MARRGHGAVGVWWSVVRAGLVWGVGAVFLSLVGLVGTSAQHQIIAGVLPLADALVFMMGLGAGVQVSRRLAARSPSRRVASAIVAGSVAGLVVAGLVIIGRTVDLRGMLVNASPALFDILTFYRGSAGLWLAVAAQAAVAAAGAAILLVPPRLRAPIVVGLATAFGVGLFQELVQILLQSGTREVIRALLFTEEGLAPRGAAVLFAIGAVLQAGWSQYRAPARQWVGGLSPNWLRMVRVVSVLGALGVIIILPPVGGMFVSQVFVLVGLYTLMGLGLNLELGFAGLLDIGFVAFFAIGAYTVALLTTTGPLAVANLSWWVAVPIATVVSLIAGILFGLPILRIRGDYLAIATLGFGEIIRLLVLSDFLRPVLGGSQGVLGIPKPVLFGFEFRGPEQIFYLTIVASAIVAFVAGRLRDSRLGRAWMAVREDEDVAEALGINTVNVKLLAYGIGGAFAGVGGAIFAVMVGSIFPHSFSVLISFNVLALIIVGGMGSLPGVMVGSLALVGLPELLREFSDFRFLVYGAVLILMVQLRPEGLWPTAVARRELHGEAEPAGAPEVPPALAGAKEAEG